MSDDCQVHSTATGEFSVNGVPVTGLRDRIAAALLESWDERRHQRRSCWPDPRSPHCQDCADADADAVMAVFAATEPIQYGPGENRYRYCCPKCGDFWFDHSGLMQRFALGHSRSHRTDWKADDEDK